MKEKTGRRLVAFALSTALISGAPGGPAYQIVAQTFTRVPVVKPTVTVGAAPMTVSNSLEFATLNAAVLPVAPALGIEAANVLTVAEPLAPTAADPAAFRDFDPVRPVEAVHEVDSAARMGGASAARWFDGGAFRRGATEARSAMRTATVAEPRRSGAIVRFVGALALAAGLAAAPPRIVAQAAPLPRPLVASIDADRADATVGEHLHLTLVLKNPTPASITVSGLRESLKDALPEDLEIQGDGAEQALTLAPGETKTVVYEAIPFASGEITIKNSVAAVSVASNPAYPQGIEIALPDTTVVVKSVLTPDWKAKGLQDIVDIQRARSPNWTWIAGGAFGALLMIGLERILAARRSYPKIDASRRSLLDTTEDEIARLEAGAATMGGAEFHAALQQTLTRVMVDFIGLPRRERTAQILAADLKAATSLRPEQVQLAADIAARSEKARFSGKYEDAAGRRRELGRLRMLVESVGAKVRISSSDSRSNLNGIFNGAELQFLSPWALILFIPFGVYLWKLWRTRGADAHFAVGAPDQISARRTWRERVSGLPRAARLSAAALLVLALARPMIGVQRLDSYTPSTDTLIIEDRSGSMSDKMGGATKLDVAATAIRAYVDEQRRGTQNRVGLETFSDGPYIDVRLTTDYDALIAHLQEVKADGSTAIGDAILAGVGHFAEVNMRDLDETSDPRIAQLKALLRDKGTAAALAYANTFPDLARALLSPDRAKVVVLFTDGESNAGIHPVDAAKIAASQGVKVYTVGIGESFDEKTLRDVAEATRARFYRAGDVEGMTQALLEISRLEKSPVKIVSSVSVNDCTALLALLAFVLLGTEALLGNTRLRTLQTLLFAASLQGLTLVRAPTAAAFSPTTSVDAVRTTRVPPELAEGNRLYAQGLYAEAVKKYAEAVAAHPDLPELYFNMGDAYLRLGDADRAVQAYQRYLSATPDPVLQSRTLFNMGNAELARHDAEAAVERYKDALRRDPNNGDAKWNLELLQKQPKTAKSGQKKGRGHQGQSPPQAGPGQPGQPGDQKGDPADAANDPKGDPQKGGQTLAKKLGEQEDRAAAAARKAITRNGTGVWAGLALPLGFAGHGISFASQALLAAVFLGVPLAALLIWYGLRRNAKAARELSPGTAPASVGSWWGLGRHRLKSALFLGALGLIGLAATDPRGGAIDQRVNFGGKDLIVMVDVSHSSVYAEDGRLVEMKKELKRFIERVQGMDRIGLDVFAKSARTAAPLSIDYGNFSDKIDRLELESRGLKEGSDLGGAVAFAAESFEHAKRVGDRPRVLIVISDGEDFSAEIADGIKAAKAHHVTVYTIGLGERVTQEMIANGTAPKMRVPTEDGTSTEYIIDSATGKPAFSGLVEKTLIEIGESTGGHYFHADKNFSIDRVLEEIAHREQGREGNTIKSPQPMGIFFVAPALALLFLDLLLPGRSLLRRDVPAPRDGKKTDHEKSQNGGPAGLLAVGLIPLGAWPQILPFAILGIAVAGLLAYDLWNDGAVTRGVREAWQRRTKFVAKGVRTDLAAFEDLREADAPRLASFIDRWQAADDKARGELIREAAADPALWREKLVAASLSGAGPDVQQQVLSALRRTARDRLEAFNPVVDGIVARRGALAWLDHADARSRLAALEEAASDQPPAAPLPSSASRGLRSRLTRWAAAGGLIISLAIGVLAADGTRRFAREQTAAEKAALQIFYGEDLYIFSDHYVDDRIPRYVLPVLRAWHKSVRDAGVDFERAMQVLRESPDPKADNLLAVSFRRGGLLPMDPAAEKLLLKAIIERDSDAIWASIDLAVARSGEDPDQAARLVKLVMLGVESGSEHSLLNMFRVLKSPDDRVRSETFEALYGSMASSPTSFFARLTAIGSRYAADPGLQTWSAIFALRRAGAPDAEALDGDQMRDFFDQLLKNAEQIDVGRLPLFGAARDQARRSGQSPKCPPAFLPSLIDAMNHFATEGRGRDEAAPMPRAPAEIVRYIVDNAVADLIVEGESDLPDLHERLIEEGVVLPDKSWMNSGGDLSQFAPPYQGGPGSTPNYREVYNLSHLRSLQAELAGQEERFHSDDGYRALAAAEFLDRAQAALKSALLAGTRAGMIEGGSRSEKVAEELEPLLMDGFKTFADSDFLTLLRVNKLAPVLGNPLTALAYPQTLDETQIDALRGLFAQMAKTGKLPGKRRELRWEEKLFIARGLDKIDAVAREENPFASAGAGVDDFERTDEEGIAAARLMKAVQSRAENGDALLALEKKLLAYLAGPQGVMMSAEDLKQVLPELMKNLKDAKKDAEGWALFEAALDAGRLPASCVAALRSQSFAALRALGEELKTGFVDQDVPKRLLLSGFKSDEDEWRAELTLRQYDALAAITREVAEAVKSAGGLNAYQLELVGRIEGAIPAMKALAAKLGVSENPAAESEANLYLSLHLLLRRLPGVEFFQAMAQKGFAVPGDYSEDTSWPAYSTPQLAALRAALAAMLDAGKWRGRFGEADLNDEQKFYFRLAIKSADEMLAQRTISPATLLHGMAPFGLIFFGTSFAPFLWAAVAAVATWLIWKYAFRAPPRASSSAEIRSASIAARRSRIDLTARRLANSVVGGLFPSRFIGAGGGTFAESRPYDKEDIREIDWKTSAKKGETYAKKFELDRDMPLILLVDVSRSGRLGARGADKRAVIEDVAATLALAASRANIRVGAVFFSDRVEAVIPARGGARHAAALVDKLMTMEPVGAKTDLRPALAQLSALARSRAMVAVVSDFLSSDFKDALTGAAAHHDLRAIRVFDPGEGRPLPNAGLLPLVDVESGEKRTLDTGDKKSRSDVAAAIARREAKLKEQLLAARTRPILLSIEGDPLDTFAVNFDRKGRHAAP